MDDMKFVRVEAQADELWKLTSRNYNRVVSPCGDEARKEIPMETNREPGRSMVDSYVRSFPATRDYLAEDLRIRLLRHHDVGRGIGKVKSTPNTA